MKAAKSAGIIGIGVVAPYVSYQKIKPLLLENGAKRVITVKEIMEALT